MNRNHDDILDRYARIASEADRIKGVSLGRDAWRRLRRNPLAMFSLWTLVTLLLLAVLTPMLPLQPPRMIEMSRQFLGPSLESAPPLVRPISDADRDLTDAERLENAIDEGFGRLDPISGVMLRLRVALFGEWSIPSICGTDTHGRDVLSRLFWGGRISIAVGIVAGIVSLVIGVTYGATSGYLGGLVDTLMMRLVDVLYSIPFIFVVIFLITILTSEGWKDWLARFGINQMMIFFLLIGGIYWLTMARVVRGQVISLKNEQFVEAARTLGAGRARIIFAHLIPNLLSVVIVYLTLTIPSVMLFEAFLSFLGLGVEPPDVSWGLLVNQGLNVMTPVRIYWWLIVFPSIAFAMTLFSLNFLGDGLRDALDPRMKNR